MMILQDAGRRFTTFEKKKYSSFLDFRTRVSCVYKIVRDFTSQARINFSLYSGYRGARYRDRLQDVLDGVGMKWEREISAL